MTRSAITADADLTIRTGTAEGRLSGSGSRLLFETSRLTPFLAQVAGDANRPIRSAVNGLASMGLSVSVIEEGVAIVDIGNVESSLIARALGFRGVRIHRPFRLLARYLRR